eukprot:NODE_90_length_21806_cov_0.389137.p4 type:complete len:508 gc:universal NODE_90_length_21806_cov_0.389137:7367-5844(-)
MLIFFCAFSILSQLDHWLTVGLGYSHSSVFYPAINMTEKPKHPVLLIPGLLTSKLESWSVKKDSCEGRLGKYFRMTIWSKMSGFYKWLLDGHCVLDYMDLDPENGRDSPSGYKVRASRGFESIDYFLGGYPVWAHLIANLATIGYDPSMIGMVPFDWRLSFSMMEERDNTFSKMKNEIELMVKKTKEKAVIISHSMGGNMNLYFIQWITNLDANWMNKNVHAWISNGTPFLGTVRGISAVLTGYIKETASGAVKSVMDLVMDTDKRQQTLSHFRSYYSVFPMGGNRIWGNRTYNPLKYNDPQSNFTQRAGGQVFTIFENGEPRSAITANEVQGRILDKLHPSMQKFAKSLNLRGGEVDSTEAGWANPLASKLPAGNYTIYCTYGIGTPSDMSYALKDGGSKWDIDSDVNRLGYKQGGYSEGLDGDQSVSLTSLGYTCKSAWLRNKYNPDNIKVITKEYEHGNYSALHVDVLHHPEFLRDMIRIVSGSTIKEEIHSNLPKIIENIDSQ